MKYFAAALFFCCIACNEQQKPSTPTTIQKDTITPVAKEIANPYEPVDVSPMDMSYLPVDYPKLKMAKAITTPPIARVIYSRPHRQGRKIFGNLLKWGEPWRLGANEATEIDLFQPITIQNKKIPQGRYILYCIPQENSWTLVFNSNIDSWGLKPDPQKDLFSFQIPVQHSDTTAEYFTIVFQPTAANNRSANLIMAWDDVVAKLLINY
ncbi:MAG: hypothetical protein C4330_11165 [Chitinophagaceae bacterium]